MRKTTYFIIDGSGQNLCGKGVDEGEGIFFGRGECSNTTSFRCELLIVKIKNKNLCSFVVLLLEGGGGLP